MNLGALAIELAAGLVAGIFAGVTGAGGGVLLVPILVWFGLPPLSATATSNVAISVSALSGTWTNLRRFALPWRRVLLLAIPAVLSAPFGVWLARSISGAALLLSFAAFNVLATGLLQLRLQMDAAAEAPKAAGGDTGADLPPANPVAALGTGLGGGALAGLFGVGGGLIMVPFQALLLSTPVRLASRISLAVVLFASVAAVAAHQVAGGDIRWSAGLVIAIGGLVGAPIGARWLHRLTDRQSTRIIQVTMLAVAASFVFRALV